MSKYYAAFLAWSRRLGRFMPLRRKVFLLCLCIVTAFVVIVAAGHRGGDRHLLQIMYSQHSWGNSPVSDRLLRM
jgi:hypothetical protein